MLSPTEIQKFELYSFEHYVPFLISFVLLIVISYSTFKLPIRKKINVGIVLSTITIVSVFLNSAYSYYYVYNEDFNEFFYHGLPLHACHFICLFNLIGIIRKDRKFLSMAYFWCMTFNIMALMMPELVYGFPSYLYILFFVSHCGNFITVLYSIIAFNLKPTFKDLIFTVLFTNIFLFATLAFNMHFDTNYTYVLRKPVTSSLLDVMGEWPAYLIYTEIIGVCLFYIFYKAFELCVDKNKVTRLE